MIVVDDCLIDVICDVVCVWFDVCVWLIVLEVNGGLVCVCNIGVSEVWGCYIVVFD